MGKRFLFETGSLHVGGITATGAMENGILSGLRGENELL